MRRLANLLIAAVLVGSGAVLASLGGDATPGRPDVAMPPLIGEKLGDASALLQGMGLCVDIEPGDGTATLGRLIEQHPRRYVVHQLPGAGALVPERTLVTLRIDTQHDTTRVLYQVAQTNRAMTCPAGPGVTGDR